MEVTGQESVMPVVFMNGNVVCGRRRLRAAKELGLDIPIEVIDTDSKEEPAVLCWDAHADANGLDRILDRVAPCPMDCGFRIRHSSGSSLWACNNCRRVWSKAEGGKVVSIRTS